jgi:hypothetical protein
MDILSTYLYPSQSILTQFSLYIKEILNEETICAIRIFPSNFIVHLYKKQEEINDSTVLPAWF